MVNGVWTCLGLLGCSLQIAHAETGDQFNAGSSREDCYQQVEQALYKAQAAAQAEEGNAVRLCRANGNHLAHLCAGGAATPAGRHPGGRSEGSRRQLAMRQPMSLFAATAGANPAIGARLIEAIPEEQARP
jgi:hypothetical protein